VTRTDHRSRQDQRYQDDTNQGPLPSCARQVEIVIYPGSDFDWAARVHGLTAAVEQAIASGVLTSEQAHGWLEDQRRAAAQGRFFSALPSSR
jgi:hypothetical protein